jgi:3-methyladenine DNA glycosylase AlkC
MTLKILAKVDYVESDENNQLIKKMREIYSKYVSQVAEDYDELIERAPAEAYQIAAAYFLLSNEEKEWVVKHSSDRFIHNIPMDWIKDLIDQEIIDVDKKIVRIKGNKY